MFEPAKECPQVTIAFRWGWARGTDVFTEAKKAPRCGSKMRGHGSR